MRDEERRALGRKLSRMSAKFHAAALLVAATAGLINGLYLLAALLVVGAAVLLVWTRST